MKKAEFLGALPLSNFPLIQGQEQASRPVDGYRAGGLRKPAPTVLIMGLLD